MDFFYVCPNGIRAGYPSARLLGSLSKRERRAVKGRVILLLTANRFYALHGVRRGARLAKVEAVGFISDAPIKIGANTWYLVPNGRSRAC